MEQPLAIFTLNEVNKIIRDDGFEPGTNAFLFERQSRFRPVESSAGFVEKEVLPPSKQSKL